MELGPRSLDNRDRYHINIISISIPTFSSLSSLQTRKKKELTSFNSILALLEDFLKMPNERKKRGRREDKKRKREEENLALTTSKRQKSEDTDHIEIIVDGDETHEGDDYGANSGPAEIPFYGLLDDDEQEYFKRADSMLELNQFANAEERSLFLNSVIKEASGKELKIANSQSCSRLMERLIMMLNPSQLKTLFQKLSGQ